MDISAHSGELSFSFKVFIFILIIIELNNTLTFKKPKSFFIDLLTNEDKDYVSFVSRIHPQLDNSKNESVNETNIKFFGIKNDEVYRIKVKTIFNGKILGHLTVIYNAITSTYRTILNGKTSEMSYGSL